MTARRICHLTSVHPRSDIRVFLKQCRSLANHGFDVTLVVADDKGDERKDGVTIVDVGRLPGRLNRIFNTTRRVFQKAVAIDAELYHLHDPELIPIGLQLKHRGKKVIFDSHEDVPRQVLSKPYLHPAVARGISRGLAAGERYTLHRFDGIIAATPFIREKCVTMNPNSVDINNFPMIGELDGAVPWADKVREVCYVGDLTAVRGIREMVRAAHLLRSSARLNLAGSFSERALEVEVQSMPGWERVNALGYLDRGGVRDLLGRSMAGLVTLHATANHMDAQPNKMFEYMSAGLPLITSDFPLWREIVDGHACGICVDPLDAAAIARSIDRLIDEPDLARRMGENGREAVMTRYNWAVEERKLLDFYAHIIDARAAAHHAD